MRKKTLIILLTLFVALGVSIFGLISAQDNQYPAIKEVGWRQLHEYYEETPHKYELFIDAADPDNNYPLSYNWSIDCGYFKSGAVSDRVEWHYDVPGECIEAKMTVIVADSLGAKTKRTQYVFEEAGTDIEEYNFPAPVEEIRETTKEEPGQAPYNHRGSYTGQVAEEEEIPTKELPLDDTLGPEILKTEEKNASPLKEPENGLVQTSEDKGNISKKAIIFFFILAGVILAAGFGAVVKRKLTLKEKETMPEPCPEDQKNDCLKEVERLKWELKEAGIDYYECRRGKKRMLEELRRRINNIRGEAVWNKWWNNFNWFRETFKVIIEMKKFTGAKISEEQLKGLWDWGGSAGASVGYAAEDLAKAPIPTDLIKVVGEMYGVFGGLLSPESLGGLTPLLKKEGDISPERIAEEFKNAIYTMKEAMEVYINYCLPFLELAKELEQGDLMEKFKRCFQDIPPLPEEPLFDLGKCLKGCLELKEKLKNEVKKVKQVVEKCEKCSGEEIEKKLENIERYKKEMEKSTQKIKESWRCLEKYREIMREYFRLAGLRD